MKGDYHLLIHAQAEGWGVRRDDTQRDGSDLWPTRRVEDDAKPQEVLGNFSPRQLSG